MGRPFTWTNLNPLHQRMLCAKFVSNWPSCSGGEDFKIFSIYFRYIAIISPWKRVWPFIWINLNLLHPRMLCAKCGWNWPCGFCAKFGWNWPSGSWGEDENGERLRTDGRTDGLTDGRKVIRKAKNTYWIHWSSTSTHIISNCYTYSSTYPSIWKNNQKKVLFTYM